MPPSDSPDDFSHLPTVEQSGEEGGPTAELWARHRKVQKRSQVAAKPTPAPASQPPPVVPADPVPAPDAEAWRSLLELEPEPIGWHTAPPPPPPPPLTPAARRKTVVRSAARPQEEPAAAEPEPVPEEIQEPPAPPPVPRAAPKAPVPAEKTEAPRPEAAAPAAKSKAEPEASPSSVETVKEADQKSRMEPTADADSASAKPGDSVPAKIEPGSATPPPLWRRQWEKIGGLALSWSVGIHLLLLAAGGFLVVSQTMERQIDFLPGGGTSQQQAASQDLEHKIQQKKSPWLKRSMPIQRLAAMDKISDIALPDQAPDLLSLPDASDIIKGKLGAGMGLGGAGGGFGNGMGLGSRSGMVFQPLSMFGREIKAKKMALILDVSASMAPHLPRVIAEVDKVAKDSIVVLYVGCGLEPPPPGKKLSGDTVFRTSGQEFEKFWRLGGGTYEEARGFRINPKDPIPMESVFRLLARRPQTYFIHAVGVSYTWLALLSSEVRSADALYWFSDFQDSVNFRQIAILRDNLKTRNQRLYIHAYQRGSAFDLVVNQLVSPTGGDVIEAE